MRDGKLGCRKSRRSWSHFPFDGTAVRSYGLVVAAVVRHGRQPRNRFADLLIAATAHANGLDLYSRNGNDYAGLEGLVTVIAI